MERKRCFRTRSMDGKLVLFELRWTSFISRRYSDQIIFSVARSAGRTLRHKFDISPTTLTQVEKSLDSDLLFSRSFIEEIWGLNSFSLNSNPHSPSISLHSLSLATWYWVLFYGIVRCSVFHGLNMCNVLVECAIIVTFCLLPGRDSTTWFCPFFRFWLIHLLYMVKTREDKGPREYRVATPGQ